MNTWKTFWEKIENFLVLKRKTIQKALLILSWASLLFLFSPDAIKQTWEMSMKLLWLVLWLPILAKVFSSRIAGKLMMFRKELGILMWTLAFVHSWQYFMTPDAYVMKESLFWVQDGVVTYLAFGLIALIIAIALTLTSNTWSMKKLWKYWKYLHRSVYVLLIFTLLHVAFIDIARSDNAWLTGVAALIPFAIYFTFKILEWKGIKLRK